MDAATMAEQDQSTREHYQADEWINVTLPAMFKVWQGEWDPKGEPGHYFFSEEDAREATGAYAGTSPYRFAQTLWRLTQVCRYKDRSFRREIREFVVDLPVEAAVGICWANKRYGHGSALQYFIPSRGQHLLQTGRTFNFASLDYPL